MQYIYNKLQNKSTLLVYLMYFIQIGNPLHNFSTNENSLTHWKTKFLNINTGSSLKYNSIYCFNSLRDPNQQKAIFQQYHT